MSKRGNKRRGGRHTYHTTRYAMLPNKLQLCRMCREYYTPFHHGEMRELRNLCLICRAETVKQLREKGIPIPDENFKAHHRHARY